jgi:hypothetical protein
MTALNFFARAAGDAGALNILAGIQGKIIL